MRVGFCLWLCIISSLLVVSCSSNENSFVDEDGFEVPELFMSAGEDIDYNMSDEDKVIEAFDNGEISKEEYLIKRAEKAFAPDAPSKRDHSPLLQMIVENFDSLSPEAQERLRPYILTPSDPKSFWYDGNDELRGAPEEFLLSNIIGFFEIIPSAYAIKNPHPQCNAFCISTTSDKFFGWLAEAFHKAHNKFKNIGMPEPDEWIYVKVMNITDEGQVWMAEHDGKERCNIIINSGLSESHMKSTAAHELFHCFQLHIPLDYTKSQWIMESTAIWSEELVYPDHNTEHDWQRHTFYQFYMPMTSKTQNHDYASYLWWFFLYKRSGSPSDIVKALFNTKSLGNEKKAVEAIPGYKDLHKKYALWNINHNPFKFYEDYKGEPKASPGGKSAAVYKVFQDSELTKSVDVNEGGIKYLIFVINNDVQKVIFDVSDFTSDDFGAQMIYKIGDRWFYEDLKGRDKVVFCRNRRTERVSSVNFIIDRPSLKDKGSGVVKVKTKKSCNPTWSGVVSYSWKAGKSDTLNGLTANEQALTSWSENGFFVSHDELIYDSENDEFLLTKQSSSYSYDYDQSVSFTGRSCGLLWDEKHKSLSGGGSHQWKINEKELWKSKAPVRISKEDGEYILRVKLASGDFRSSTVHSSYRKPCLGEGIIRPEEKDDAVEVRSDTYSLVGDSGGIIWPSSKIVLSLSDNRKELKGSGESTIYIGDKEEPIRFQAEFYYE